MSYEDFIRDEKTSFAVLRCIEIMGEAAKHVPESIRLKYSEIHWKDIGGMRDKVVHFYFGVELKRVWLVIKEDMPENRPNVPKTKTRDCCGRYMPPFMHLWRFCIC